MGAYKCMYFKDQLVIEVPPGYVAKRFDGMTIFRKRKSFIEWIKEVPWTD
jgi:hypothetical protein